VGYFVLGLWAVVPLRPAQGHAHNPMGNKIPHLLCVTNFTKTEHRKNCVTIFTFLDNILTQRILRIKIKYWRMIEMFDIDGYNNKINNFFEIMLENKNIVDKKLFEEKWSLKEMVGHLIDSASNNHQRIIRLQIDKKIDFPAYDAENWKDITKIKEFNFVDLINLWRGYNYFLLHLIKNISEDKMDNIWEINGKDSPQKILTEGKEMTLKYIIEDYFERHMDWHIELYKNRIEEIIGKNNE
jgi:hypothetical protein